MKTIVLFLLAAFLTSFSSPAWAQGSKDILDDNYILRSGDFLTITIFPQAELSDKQTIQEDGAIVLKTVGRIKIQGKSVQDASRLVEQRLGRYFRNPKVTLSVARYSAQHVIMTGEIRNAGLRRFEPGLTLSEIIIQAGGFTNDADRKHVRVYRGDKDSPDIKIVDVEAILAQGDFSNDFPIEPGDRIEVPRRVNVIYVWGAVSGAGSYDYFAGMKMLDLVTRARGLGVYARSDSIRIFREGGEVFEVDFRSVLQGDMSRDVELQPGDIIFVPSTALSKTADKVALLQPWLTLLTVITTISTVLLLL